MTKKITHRALYKTGRRKLTEQEKEISKEKKRLYQNMYKKAYVNYHPAKRLLWAATRRAKSAGIECTITLGDIVIPTHCPYLGIELVNSRQRGDSRRDIASLDRVDPTKGYTKDNIEVISWLANTMKNNATPELLVSFAKEVLKRYDTNPGL
jgi:hypothetical protein